MLTPLYAALNAQNDKLWKIFLNAAEYKNALGHLNALGYLN